MSIILFTSHWPLATSHFLTSHLILADSTATTIFLLGLLLIVAVVLRGARRKSSAIPPPVSSWGKSLGSAERSAQRDPPADLSRWEVQMHELARDLSGQLDSKIVILQHLVRDAQQQADRLEQAIARANESGIETSNPPPGPSSAARESAAVWNPPPLTGAVTNPSEAAPAARTTVSTLSVPARRYEEIYRLADEGFSSASIAHETGSPIGEIELILSLRNKAG